MHLCEAPGGFVSALNHYLKTNFPHTFGSNKVLWEWKASTLNPNYEGNPLNQMIPDDRLIMNTKDHWLYGLDNTGDIMKYYNREIICLKAAEKGKMDLITADGSVDCMDDPGDQETTVHRLHFCEVFTALSILKTGGNFVLKIFTCFEDTTICILYLLNCSFESVSLFKPITSKSGNSETYVICKHFRGFSLLAPIWSQLIAEYRCVNKNKSMFQLEEIDSQFIAQVEECAEFFKNKQIHTIEQNIEFFGCDNSFLYNQNLYRENRIVAKRFLHLYPIRKLEEEKRIVPYSNQLSQFWVKTDHSEVFSHFTSGCKEVQLNFVTGKALEKVFYSKFISDCNKLDIFLKTRRSNNHIKTSSLYETVKNRVISARIKVFDYLAIEYANMPQYDFQNILLDYFYDNFTSNCLMLVNVPIITNFLVGLFYILSHKYHIYFFKKGLIVLQKNKSSYFDLLCKFQEIKEQKKLCESTTVFQEDLLDIVRDCNKNFLSCVHFYNDNLC